MKKTKAIDPDVPRWGVFGGSFDPVHLGHLIIGEEVAERLGLEKILFVPARYQWLKGRALTAVAHRWRMLELAVAGNPLFDLSPVEIDRPGPSYTVDTLLQLSHNHPGVALYFILGWDALKDFPQWKDPQRIIRLCRLVAVPRPGVPRPEVSRLEAEVPGISERLILLESPLIGISSSEIRERLAQGRSIRYLVPASVEAYIREHGLYR